MMRYLKIFLLAMLAVGLVASGAFAAGTVTWYSGNGTGLNTAYTVAYEAMGTARTLNVGGGVTASGSLVAPAFVITTAAPLLSNTFLNISFTNAGFTGDTFYACLLYNDGVANNSTANSGGVLVPPIGTGGTTGNATMASLIISNSVVAGARLMITTAANATNCASNGVFPVRLPAFSSTGGVGVSYTATSGSSTYDSGAGVNNIANIARQYSTAYVSNTSYIDYLNAPANGSKFATNTVYTTSSNAYIGATAPDVGTLTYLSVSALLSLQDTASWQGVTSVYLRSVGPCGTTGGSNNAANNSPSGTVNLAVPAAIFNGANTTSPTLLVCAQIAGNAVLQSRAIKGAFDINLSGTGGNDPAMDTYTPLMSWQSNGYQGLIPYISAQSIYNTICFINNKGSASGTVTADILSSESGATLSALSGLSLGTLAGLSTVRVDFASSITPYTYSGGVETASTTPTALTGLQANDRYTAMINVGVDPSQITINCLQMDPAGSKRAVPVLTKGSSVGTYWQQ